MNDELIGLAITIAPDIIKRLKGLFTARNPDVPPPTDDEVIAAYETAFQSSIDKDDRWLAAHPESVE